MPPISEIYWEFREKLVDPVVIRLHGTDRQAIEESTGEVWDKVVEPKDEDLEQLVQIVRDLRVSAISIALSTSTTTTKAPRLGLSGRFKALF